MKQPKRQPWSANELKLLGKFPDSVVAKKLSRNQEGVSRQRQRLGIPPVRSSGFDPRHKHLLGTIRDEDLAIKLDCALITIIKWRIRFRIPCFASKSKPWTREELALLGKYPDREIARRLNRDPKKVRNKRLRIAKKRRNLWSKKQLAMLGTMPDRKLAKNSDEPICPSTLWSVAVVFRRSKRKVT